MRSLWRIVGVSGAMAGALAAGFAVAQETPESLLPPGFDRPDRARASATPTPSPIPSPTPPPTAAPIPVAPAAPTQAAPLPADDEVTAPNTGPSALPPIEELNEEELRNLPTIEELEKLSTDELDELFGLKPKFDIPPAARRSLAKVGVISRDEGGFPAASLRKQPASLVRAILTATKTPLVSRWGHILMRRALASRLASPEAMPATEFAALRAGALNAMGEFSVARALIQDVDAGNWSPALADAALGAFVAEADPLGVCPYIRFQGVPEKTGERAAQWTMAAAICNAFTGETALAGSQLDRALSDEIAPAIDILLARRFAGAAGRGRRAVEIEWDGVDRLNAWRFAMANAVGEQVPDALLETISPDLERAGANAAMVPLAQRAEYAARAAAEGIFSAHAMIDIYSEIYSDNSIGGDLGDRARGLRTAYLASQPQGRVDAMEALWNSAAQGRNGYWARVMTAFAAARIPPATSEAGRAGDLIASMLTAGLDRDALSWKPVLEEGSYGWALLALAEARGGVASQAGLDDFADNDTSDGGRKSQFLIAGLAGLGRIDAADRGAFENRLSMNLGRETRWVRMIRRAAEVKNPAMVALLTGLGMQGTNWSQMTPLHLYHITAALSEVGLDAEARMIAAEAVARG